MKKYCSTSDINNAKITIVDSIMGSGKTTWSVNKMRGFGSRYIYITPFLEEIERVKSSLEGARDLYEPSNKNKLGSKKHDFYNFVKNGLDIVATHSLFSSCDKEILEYLRKYNYTLILDEVINVIEIKNLSKADYDMLLETNSISIDDNGKVVWQNDNYNGSFDWFKEYALAGQLYKHKSQDTDKKAFFVWQFPVEIFKYFKEVYILTYLFDGQIQKYYFDMHGLKYEYKQIEQIDDKYVLVDYDKENEYKRLRQFKKLINIYNEKLNNIGDGWNSFSASYFKKSNNSQKINQLKKNTENYIQHIVKGKSNTNMWTTYKDNKNSLKGKGYSKGFVEVNSKATNQYAHNKNLAYLCNRFLHPYEANYFRDLGIQINEDLWALSELVQWIWRSAIRNNEPINIYIPSSRMRTLLINWLECKEREKAA